MLVGIFTVLMIWQEASMKSEDALSFVLLNTFAIFTIIYAWPLLGEGDQPWDFFGRNDAKAETPGLWPLHAKT